MSAASHVKSFLEAIRSRGLAKIEDRDFEIAQVETNVGEFVRHIASVLLVDSRENLPGIIEEANRWKVPLYPFSRGCNWGYGSKLPALVPTIEGGVLLDLSQLNKIIKIDEEQGVATIEPGVTQKQLADELAKNGSRYFFDVTGSGAETSVLGNALERGIAYGSLRAQQLTGMEVFLGNGKKIRTGFGDFPNSALTGLYSYGLGPAIDGLFFQSNLGIVVEADMQLSLKPECLIGVTVAFNPEDLSAFMDQVRELLRFGYLSGIPHIANRERTLSTIIPLVAEMASVSSDEAKKITANVIREEWTLTAAVAGSPKIANEKLKHIKRNLRAFGRVYSYSLSASSWKSNLKDWLIGCVLNREQKIVIEASKPLRAFHQGIPSNAGVQFLLPSVGGNAPAANQVDGTANATVDNSPEGFLLCTPLAPLSGESARVFVQVAQEQANKHQVRFAMTLNMLSNRILEAVISVHFARASAQERARAHQCVHDMTETFSNFGFYPYRINIDQQKTFQRWSPALGSAISSIKSALDPNKIIAPGRYGE